MKYFIFLISCIVFFAFLPLAVAEEPITNDTTSWGEIISKEEAEQYTQYFSMEIEGIKAHLFSSSILLGIINQENAIGVRFYHALVDGKPTLVVVGVDKNGNDLLNEKFAERSRPCPPMCVTDEKEMDFSQAGEFITREEAELYTQNFTRNIGGIRAHLFSANILMSIISQNETKGVRLYYGEYDNRITLVAVGVDARGNDILEGKLVERSRPCPPMCNENEDIIAIAKIK